MRRSSLRPVAGRAALTLDPESEPRGRWLVVADLHLGLGAEDPRRGPPATSAARDMVEELLGVARQERARRLLVAGDVKHPIVGVPLPLRAVLFDFFSTLLSAGIEVEVIRGNHDVGVDRFLPREVAIRPSGGVRLGSVGVFHGHRWPTRAVLAAGQLVTGHLHPGVRLAPTTDRPAGKERCWVRVAIPPPPTDRRRRRRVRARELVVLPAFNPLAGIEALNREKPRRGRSFLFRRFLALGEARAYLLDGTDLGAIVTTSRDRRSG